MNKKGRIPPLAYALIVVVAFILLATFVPAVKNTAIEMLSAIFS